MIKTKICTVVKLSSDKTVKVKYILRVMHKKYKKTIIKTRFLLVHDNDNKAKLNDKVEITQCRPISKNKHFYISNILQKT